VGPRPDQQTFRYLVSYSDGGAAMRNYNRPLDVGDVFHEAAGDYRVIRVVQAGEDGVTTRGQAWLEPV
jgi:hypothetical protein